MRDLERVIVAQGRIARLALDFDAIMSFVAREARGLTEADGAVVELVEGQEMVYKAVAGLESHLNGLRIDREESLSGLCVETATPLYCKDSETDERVSRDACRKVGLRSMIVVPLLHGSDAVGALKVISRQPDAFDGRHLRILSYVADMIATSLYVAEKYSQDELFRRATRDELTGLANRALFHDRLWHDTAQAKREDRSIGVIVVDMDGLKQLNDEFGHHAGDAGLRALASRLAAQVRQSDTIARLGGDEFAIILSPVADREAAEQVKQRLQSVLREPLVLEGRLHQLSASFGLALYPDEGENLSALLKKADQEMYEHKRARRWAERE